MRCPNYDPEDHAIWSKFQHKFMLTFQLYGYEAFFKKILMTVTLNYIQEMVAVVEYRHILGCLHDEDGPVPLEREMALF